MGIEASICWGNCLEKQHVALDDCGRSAWWVVTTSFCLWEDFAAEDLSAVHTVGVLGSCSETKMIGWLVVQQDLFSWRSDSAMAASGCYARLLVCS
jgi:hypothetical protein